MLKYLPVFLICVSTLYAQQLQWILLSDGTSLDTPPARSDAALGFDQTFIILYGGRTQTGMPLQDSYSFNILTGQWDTLTFPSPPSSRYGMASANAINSGLYLFGGFALQGSSQNYNPYTAYGSGQYATNYNYATPPNFMQNPILMNNPDFVNNPNYNPMSGTGYNTVSNDNKYSSNDNNYDENYYPVQDAWFLSYATKTWQPTQTSQYARGFGSAAASPSSNGVPKVLYTMGKSRDWMYSIVESIGQGASGLSQSGTTQASIIMNDLPSLSPAYPHARYGHSTALLTDNHLLLFGGCLSGYGKGGPCPSTDSWLLYIDRGHWERLGECPTTKTGAAMVALPSYSTCAALGQGNFDASANIGTGAEQPIAILWGGLEKNPSSIRTYPSPRDEVAVFSLNQKEWYLKRAAPSPMDGSYPMQREGAAYVAGCFQGVPGMFVFGGRATADRRFLSDLWFLQASPQDVLGAPRTRGCIYPFSYYHLHGIFQFLTYGVIFPFGYAVGRHAGNLSVKRPLHMILQIFGVVLAVCGFSFGVYSVRAPSWLHFRHPHAIIGIITFILTMFQFVVGLVGAIFITKRNKNGELLNESDPKLNQKTFPQDRWAGDGAWRLVHWILGSLIVLLGLINISLGVFLAVLPLPVWIIWYIYMSIIVIVLFVLEYYTFAKRRAANAGGSYKIPENGGDLKRASQVSVKYLEDPVQQSQLPRRSSSRVPSMDMPKRDSTVYRRKESDVERYGDSTALLTSNQSGTQRQPRASDVGAPPIVPEYDSSTGRTYSISSRKKSRLDGTSITDDYLDYIPEHEQSLLRPTTQQQGEYNLTRVRLQ